MIFARSGCTIDFHPRLEQPGASWGQAPWETDQTRIESSQTFGFKVLIKLVCNKWLGGLEIWSVELLHTLLQVVLFAKRFQASLSQQIKSVLPSPISPSGSFLSHFGKKSSLANSELRCSVNSDWWGLGKHGNKIRFTTRKCPHFFRLHGQTFRFDTTRVIVNYARKKISTLIHYILKEQKIQTLWGWHRPLDEASLRQGSQDYQDIASSFEAGSHLRTLWHWFFWLTMNLSQNWDSKDWK